MKYLALLFMIAALPAQAESYFGCGGKAQHSSLNSGDWLQQNYLDMGVGHCQLDHTPALAQNGFTLTLPSISYQQGRVTSWSRQTDSDLNKLLKVDVSWPIWRLGQAFVGIKGGHYDLRQQQQLNENLNYLPATILLTGQTLPVRNKSDYAGLFLDTKLLGHAITQVAISYHRNQLPLLIYQDSRPSLLADAKLSSLQIGLSHKANPQGISLYWEFNAERGQIDSLTGLRSEQLNIDEYVGVNFTLGLMAKYRLSTHLHPYIDINTYGSYWYFSEEKDLAVANLHQLDYAASFGLLWRFR